MYIFRDLHNLGIPYKFIHPAMQRTVYSIVKQLSPYVQSIIIFGSSVRCDFNKSSDLDLCLVGDGKNIPNINRELIDDIDIDILIYSSLRQLFEDALSNINGIESKIIKEGVVVYGKIWSDRQSKSEYRTL